VLFLDELPEFPRVVLETLRQPLEDGHVTIARAHGTVRFPARFMLVAAMNPTPRGDVAPGEVGKREMDRYLGKISGPLLDRIDLHVHAPRVPWEELSGKPTGTDSAAMRAQVHRARAHAATRGQTSPNRDLRGSALDQAAAMGDEAMSLLRRAIEGFGLSARAYDKVRRIARTIADVDGSDGVEPGHVLEAVQYRVLDRKD
jgi:magnesium chelatase family protein